MIGWRRCAWALVSGGLLAGCASTSPPVPAPAPAPTEEAAPPPLPMDSRPLVERQLSERAEAAEAQGRLADALWAREALVLLRPGDAILSAQWSRLRALRDQRAAEALARGREWQRRGDADRAQRSFLAALALDPGHAAAAEALRALERERQERQQPSRFAREPLAAKPGDGTHTPSESNLAEHASMLAAQGEIDAAIGLLARAGGGMRADPALRRQLAGLHLRRAQGLPPERRADALAALREALRLDPGLDAARQLQQQLAPR